MTIAFDVDGTLLDSRARYFEAHILALTEGKTPLTIESYWELKRQHVPEKDILLSHGLAENYEAYEKRRVECLENPELLRLDTPLPTVTETLAILKKEHRLIIISLRRNPIHLPPQLERFFPGIFSLIQAGPPDPTPWEAKARLLAEHAQDATWIVGDTEADVKGGALAGMKTCAVTTGIRTRESLEAMSPTALIDSLAELPRILHQR